MGYVCCCTLDLYCDQWHPTSVTKYAQYTGRTKAACIREAQADGWRIQEQRKDRPERVICPRCARLAKEKPVLQATPDHADTPSVAADTSRSSIG